MAKKRSFTLIELMIGLCISMTVFFIILEIFNIGTGSYENLTKGSRLYSDTISGFELIKNSVRKAQDIVAIQTWPNPPWKSKVLVVDNTAFGIYQASQSQPADLVFLKDKNNTNSRDVILGKMSSVSWTLSQAGKLLTVQLQAEKGKEDFNLTAEVANRN